MDVQQPDKNDLYRTALTLESLKDRRAAGPLVAALRDENQYRRTGAARTLGWIWRPGPKAALALAECLADRTQPLGTRRMGREALAMLRLMEPFRARNQEEVQRIRADGNATTEDRRWAEWCGG